MSGQDPIQKKRKVEAPAPRASEKEAALQMSAAELSGAMPYRTAVQRKAAGKAGTESVHQIAAEGMRGPAGSLPYAGAIQASFGRHDVSSVQSYAAPEAASRMGAQAYASGERVAFGGAPSLRTAAHEAAHVVQQRSGVQLSGGVGKAGDRYEQHADRVADTVAAGRSAEGLLDSMSGGGARGVQMVLGMGKKKGGKKKVAHATGKQADKKIRNALKKVVSGLKTGKVAEGMINVVDDTKFKEQYDAYFGDDGEYDITNAFVQRDKAKKVVAVWVHEERGNAGTVIHEAVHLFSDTSFLSTLGKNVNEGATEYFARIAMGSKVAKTRNNYGSEVTAIEVLIGKSSQELLAGAYFKGEIDALKTKIGATKFNKWVTKMKAKKYAEAGNEL